VTDIVTPIIAAIVGQPNLENLTGVHVAPGRGRRLALELGALTPTPANGQPAAGEAQDCRAGGRSLGAWEITIGC
jgi:hypothetical protein